MERGAQWAAGVGRAPSRCYSPGAQAQAGDGGRGDNAVYQLLDDPAEGGPEVSGSARPPECTPGARAPPPLGAPSPFQRGDAFVPAGGPPSSEAGTGLAGAIAVPGRVLSLPPALGVPAVVRLRPGRERGDVKAVVKDAESKVPVALRQCEQWWLLHVLGERRAQVSEGHLPAQHCWGGGRASTPLPSRWWPRRVHTHGKDPVPAPALIWGVSRARGWLDTQGNGRGAGS